MSFSLKLRLQLLKIQAVEIAKSGERQFWIIELCTLTVVSEKWIKSCVIGPTKQKMREKNDMSPSAISTSSSIVNRHLKSLQGIEIWSMTIQRIHVVQIWHPLFLWHWFTHYFLELYFPFLVQEGHDHCCIPESNLGRSSDLPLKWGHGSSQTHLLLFTYNKEFPIENHWGKAAAWSNFLLCASLVGPSYEVS